jgi:hypothetical protein
MYEDLFIRLAYTIFAIFSITMGMRQQIADSQNATKPVQNTADDH